MHDFINLVLVFIITYVGIITASILTNSFVDKNLLEAQMVEWVWTLAPAILLTQVAAPSLLLLYIIDESIDSHITIKVRGNQWYWRYEYSDHWSQDVRVSFDAYMLPEGEQDNTYRLLDTDNRAIMPILSNIKMILTSTDVIHAWTVPALGVKADAFPGRLNQVHFIGQRPGVFYGQCSEICGANHRFIPIRVELVNIKEFTSWLVSVLQLNR